MNNRDKSISSDLYFYLQSIGSRYEGYVDGVGYVSSEIVIDVSTMPRYPNEKSLYYNNNDTFLTTRYVSVVIPGAKPSSSKYDQLTEEDIKRAIVSKNMDGTIRVNMGSNHSVNLSPEGTVNVRIREEFFDGKKQKTVTIIARDPATGAVNQTRTQLEGIDNVLHESNWTFRMPPTQDGMIMNNGSSNSSWSTADILSGVGAAITHAALATTTGQMIYFDKFLDIWMGKNYKIYSHRAPGNGTTGGKLKYGKATADKFGNVGKGLTYTSAFLLLIQGVRGDISLSELLLEESSLVIMYMIKEPSYALAWSIGWETGRLITTMESYQRFKFNFWYDYWESKVGSPSESNKELWLYFYENYQ